MARFSPVLSLSEFRARFPEFGNGTNGASDALVQSKLDAADALVHPETWGDLARHGAYQKAAHLVALSPYGADMRLSSDNGQTIYGVEFDRMLSTVPRGGVVL